MVRRARLLLVSNTLSEGGAERFASTLLAHLDRRRFEPALGLLRGVVTYPLPGDVPVEVFDHRGARTIPRTIRAVRRWVENAGADLVLSNVAYTSQFVGPALRPAAPRRSDRRTPRWIARVGSEPGNPRGLWGAMTRAWLRRAYRPADRFVANSDGLAEAFARCYPFAAGRIERIGNPVDFSELDRRAAEPPERRAEPGAPVLISVGRLHRDKRPDVLLEAFSRVRRERDVRLWICGDGPLRAETERRIVELGLEGAVDLLGFRDNPYTLMRQATLFLITSDHEGLPNALIEAQGLGLPAVATRCPYGPGEIVEDGVTGVLVEPGDPAAVAGAVLRLLDDPDRRAAIGRAAAASARRRFDVAAVVGAWEELLLRMAGHA